MTNFFDLRSGAGLTLDEVGEVLKLSRERVAAYEEGSLNPSTREVHVLRGLSFGVAAKSASNNLFEHVMIPELRVENQMNKPLKKRSSRAFTSLELCAGGGGAAIGLEQAGFEPVALMDNDRHACATLRNNRPYWNVIEADIRRFDAKYWRGVDLLSGGLPCPPFSIAGKQLGADDDRDLFPAMLGIVREVQPRALLIENVRGILTERFSPFRARVDQALEAEGFDTYWTAFNAANFGVPQQRFRVFLVALRKGETKPLKWPIATSEVAPTVGQAIGDLMAGRSWRGASDWIKRANSPAPTIVGGSKKHGGPDLGPSRARREWAALGVDGIGIADEPPARDFSGMPRLTVQMVARIQSFPDDWKFVGSKTHVYRQVGNALPVKLAYNVASAVADCLS